MWEDVSKQLYFFIYLIKRFILSKTIKSTVLGNLEKKIGQFEEKQI